MRVRTRWTAGLLAAAVAVTLSACGGSDDGGNDADGIQTLPPATAAQSPTGTARPAGTVAPQAAARAMAVAGTTTAVLGTDGRTITLHARAGHSSDGQSTAGDSSEQRTAGGPEPRIVTAPVADLADLIAVEDHFLAIGPTGLVRIETDGRVSVTDEQIDAPLSLATYRDETLVGTAKGQIVVLGRDGERDRVIDGFARVDDILVAPASATEVEGQVSVLDRAQSAILPVDIETGEHKAALRAGNGATNAVVDDFGRIMVTGTRDDQFYVFFGSPIVMRLRAPAPQSPYALAYDGKRALLWVSSTAENEAVAYDVSRGDAIERDRVATVGQVTAMTVDPTSGDLLIASGRGDGLQTVPPTDPTS